MSYVLRRGKKQRYIEKAFVPRTDSVAKAEKKREKKKKKRLRTKQQYARREICERNVTA